MKSSDTPLKSLTAFSLSVVFPFVFPASTPAAGLYQDFDGGGTTPWVANNVSGATLPTVLGGGPSGNYARIIYLEPSDNSSIAFDEHPGMTGPAPYGMRLLFDFRLSDDAANAAAGGCCGSAADGIGIGLFATSLYGTTGAFNAGSAGADWERPHFSGAFAVGLDIFQNIDVVSLNWDGMEIASADLHGVFDLNDFVWHRLIVEAIPDGANAIVDVSILGDVYGNMSVQQVFSGQSIPGLDLSNLPSYRLIAGGRTGGAFATGDLDNISLVAVPEPSAMALLVLGAGLLLTRRHTGQ